MFCYSSHYRSIVIYFIIRCNDFYCYVKRSFISHFRIMLIAKVKAYRIKIQFYYSSHIRSESKI